MGELSRLLGTVVGGFLCWHLLVPVMETILIPVGWLGQMTLVWTVKSVHCKRQKVSQSNNMPQTDGQTTNLETFTCFGQSKLTNK
jgi:hypothetical protein